MSPLFIRTKVAITYTSQGYVSFLLDTIDLTLIEEFRHGIMEGPIVDMFQ